MKSHQRLIRCCYTNGSPLTQQLFLITLNDQKVQINLNEEGYSQDLSSIISNWDGTLTIDHCEMIDNRTGYPTHKQVFPLHHLKDNPSPLLITVLPPPIVVNLSHQFLLNNEQLKYFKENGNNVLLFIHGYNLKLGNYGCYPQTYEIQKNLAIIEPQFKNADEKTSNEYIEFKKSQYTRTICCDLTRSEEILAFFPELFHCYKNYFSRYHTRYNPEGLGTENTLFNGTEAHQWFVHMEYNFNYAAGFRSGNYQLYTRLLNIYWPGNVYLADFREAEKIADNTANILYSLIKQLIDQKIMINIVAHSLGCRIVLQTMRKLAENGYQQCLEHIILWQAALPSNALTNNPIFSGAYKSSKKISVLYSPKDSVLRTFYATSDLNKFIFNEALGYAGIKMDRLSTSLQSTGRLINVNQSKHLFGHSFMKIPSPQLMQDIYKEYIIGGQSGIRHFGRYSLSLQHS